MLTRQAHPFWQDLRFGARILARTPVATITAIVTLALTIGATTAIFSVVEGVLLSPLPYPESDRIVRVWEVSPRGDDHNVVSVGNYLDWRDRARSFESLGAYRPSFPTALTGEGEPSRVDTASLTASAFDVLGVRPILGRTFSASEGETNGPDVAILTYGFWRRGFAGDPAVVGRTITIDGLRREIVGVMPRGFDFPSPHVDLIVPFRFTVEERAQRRSHNLLVIGRLSPDATVGGAAAEVATIAGTLVAEHPADMTGWSTNVVAMHTDDVRGVRTLLWLVMAVVAVVLLIACANLANLQLARASRRVGEVAIRSAVGADRRRLFLQFLTESAVLAAIGGGLGLAVAAASLRTIVAWAPPDIPFLQAVGIDPSVLLASMVATVLCSILMGTAPALYLARIQPGPQLHSVRTHSSFAQRMLRHGLVVAQVGLALVLLVAAGLLIRSFWNLQAVDPGFVPAGLLTVELDLPSSRYPDNASHVRFYDGLIERLTALPGVSAAAGTTAFPGNGSGMTFSFAIEGRPSGNPSGREDPVPLQAVTPGYFATMGIPLLEGRALLDTDRVGGNPVVVINQALARRLWPEGKAVGHRIAFRQGSTPWREVVGVVGDTRDEGLEREPLPTIYVAFGQKEAVWAWMTWQTLVLRVTGDPAAVVPAVRRAVWDLDPNLPVLDISTMDLALAERAARRRFAMQLLAGFAGLAVLIGAIGIYGILSYSVSERQQEIGIRMALGASPAQVGRSLLRTASGLAALGVAAGALIAAGVTRFLDTLLFGVPPGDPVTFGAMCVMLLAIALLASWLPARRAMRLDPVQALRDAG